MTKRTLVTLWVFVTGGTAFAGYVADEPSLYIVAAVLAVMTVMTAATNGGGPGAD